MSQIHNERSGQQTATLLPTIDLISKMVALCIGFIYVSGFLITSLNDFRYGFSEMNPFRPRILAAGGWFLLFCAVPFELIRLLLKHPVWKPDIPAWYKAVPLIFFYFSETCFLTLWAGVPFAFDDDHLPKVVTTEMIVVLVILSTVLISLVVFLEKIPKRVKAALTFAVAAYLVWLDCDQLFRKKLFEFTALQLWFFAFGAIALIELKSRQWKFQLGYWPRGVVLYLAGLTAFATIYYPHLKASYGGGAPIPIQVTFASASPVFPGQQMNCLLVDETDSAFYLTGKNETHATLVPKSSVVMVRFSDGSEPSIFSAKTK